MVVYLAHKYENRDLGEEIQAELEGMGLRVLNPFRRPEQELYDRIVRLGDGDLSPYADDIVRKDLAQVGRADAVVVLLGPNSIGSVCEMFYAGHVRRIPVFLWQLYPAPYVHPWLAKYARVYGSREELLKGVWRWAEAQNILRAARRSRRG